MRPAVDLARETALKIIYDVNEKSAYSNISINKFLKKNNLGTIDRSFITELVYGSIKWKLLLDWVIGQFSKVKFKKISPWVLNVLRLGVYQILLMDRIPDSAACNESVKLAKRYGHKVSAGFVNGVLRNIARNKKNVRLPDRNKDYTAFLSIRYSHPRWMVEKFLNLYGEEFTEKLLKANNETVPLTVRVNTLKTTKESVMEQLESQGIEVYASKYIQEALTIENTSSIAELDAFKNGYFQVQDESSMMVSRVLDPQPGELVVDVCSAPGGKATHMAQMMNNKGRIIARDIHLHKIKLINDSARRLGINIINTEVFDAIKVDPELVEKADRVLVDAPCTGLGIIRRKPDIKWSRDATDIKGISAIQREILNAACKYVKPGGMLVYSTCTVLPEENEEIVDGFLRKNKDFEFADISYGLPEVLQRPSAKEGYIKIFPNTEGIDGFFIAGLKKRG